MAPSDHRQSLDPQFPDDPAADAHVTLGLEGPFENRPFCDDVDLARGRRIALLRHRLLAVFALSEKCHLRMVYGGLQSVNATKK